MPTILRVDAYRFFFYAGDRDEPVRVHVERDDSIAKLWLEPSGCRAAEGARDAMGATALAVRALALCR